MQNKANSKASPPRKQRGNALLIFFLLVAMGMLSLLVGKLNSTPNLVTPSDRTQPNLVEAKQLVLYALLNHMLNAPPDPFAEGRLPITLVPANGRQTDRLSYAPAGLPWLTDPESNLWYSASGSLITNTGTDHLTLCNSGAAATGIVLALIAPGPTLPGQTSRGPSAGANQYLEGALAPGCPISPSNSDTPPDQYLVSAPASGTFNDQLITITQGDILLGLYQAFANAMSRHAGEFGSYPIDKASTPNLPPGITSGRYWFDQISYTRESGTLVKLTLGPCKEISVRWDNVAKKTSITPANAADITCP